MSLKHDTAVQTSSPRAGEALVREAGVLDVARSALGKKWVFTSADERLAQGISQAYGLPDIVSRLLVSRGIHFDSVGEFLNPALKTQLPDPSLLRDMDKAAERLADVVMQGQKIAVFGDYDVDGATSTALLRRYFRALGSDLVVYIPDRIKEGYGPNTQALLKLRQEGAEVVITVDCGATAYDPLAEGTAAGLDIIVLDHHRTEARLPEAFAVVNPNRLDDDSQQGHLAAVGVSFLAMVAINRVLRGRGWFTPERPEPRILQWLDIVALGTVCDVVPLIGVNRAFVAQGLRVMALRQNPGIVALSEVADLSEAPSTFHAGFVFGPRVNAGGRVGEPGLGSQLLSTDDPLEAKSIALKLHQYNAERKAIETAVLEDALAQVENNLDDLVLTVSGEGWHPGVIGIVAARLKEKFSRPVCVVAFDEQGMGKASGRSVSNIDLGAAVLAAREAGLLVNGGGHKMAAGFTVTRELLDDLRAMLNRHAADQLKGQPYSPELRLDNVLSLHALTLDLVEKLEMLAPYGAGHAEPRFALHGIKIIRPTVVGENHVSCFLQDTSGGASVKGIAFRAMDSALGGLLLKAGSAPLHLAGHVTVNNWQGRKSVNFQIVDAAKIWD